MIKALLSDKGTISTTRFMALSSLAVGSFIGLYGVFHCQDLGGITQLASVFIGAAFLGKVSQKFIENKE